MILLEDTRNQIGKHKNIYKYCEENNIEIVRSKLIVGDYMSPRVATISVDTKFGLAEIMKNITEKRFKNELELAKKLGIHLFILIEQKEITCIDDISKKWENPRLDFYKFQMRKQLDLRGDFNEWYLYRLAKDRGFAPKRPPQSAEQLEKSLRTIESNTELYDVSFEFCEKSETGKRIIELLDGE